MAKPDIGSKEFSTLLEPLTQRPHKLIIKRLDAKMFALDQNKVFAYKPGLLAFQEFSRCLSLYETRNPGLKISDSPLRLSGVQNLINKEESKYLKELQVLAIDTIKNIYDVPDYVDMRGMIQPRLNLDTEQDHDKETFTSLSLAQKNQMRDEIQKRIILNGLVHGSSMHVWKGIYHMVSPELERINPKLKELYDYYTSTLGILIWQMNPDEFQEIVNDGVQLTQGFNKLKFDRTQGFGGRVEAKGINFPVLLHELNKGVIDWLITAGVPRQYNEEELKYYYAKADSYENELYHYLLAPSLWAELLDAAHVPNTDIPKLISHLVKLSYPELVELFRMIQDDKESASKKIKGWKII